MFGPMHAGLMLHRMNQAKNPRPGWCDCPKTRSDLDHSKIAEGLGADKVVCMRCNRRITIVKKAKRKSKKQGR